jgi:hypothetical protein
VWFLRFLSFRTELCGQFYAGDLTTSTKPFVLFDTWNAAPSAGIDRTVMLRLLIDQGLEMFVRLTVRERDHPDKLGRLLADYAPDPIKLCHCFNTYTDHLHSRHTRFSIRRAEALVRVGPVKIRLQPVMTRCSILMSSCR